MLNSYAGWYRREWVGTSVVTWAVFALILGGFFLPVFANGECLLPFQRRELIDRARRELRGLSSQQAGRPETAKKSRLSLGWMLGMMGMHSASDSAQGLVAAVQSGPQAESLVFDYEPPRLDYLPFFISNEKHYYTVADHLAQTPADIHVGFGSLINYNLIGSRPGKVTSQGEESRIGVFADISDQVVIGLKFFWRTIWLAAETPEQWLGFVSNLRVDERTTVDELFRKIETRKTEDIEIMGLIFPGRNDQGAPHEVASLRNLETRLASLETTGQVSRFSAQFTRTILEQELQGCDSIFEEVSNGSKLGLRVQELLDVKSEIKEMREAFNLSKKASVRYKFLSAATFSDAGLEENIRSVTEATQKTSFLLNRENYLRVRKMYLEGNDYYAVADFYDPNFWKAVGRFAENLHREVTDVYGTCILCVAAYEESRGNLKAGKCSAELNRQLEASIRDLPGSRKYFYESTCPMLVKEFRVREITRD